MANDFVSKCFQEASFKHCLFSLSCIQLKTLPSQAKTFQSKGCQCLFTVRERASIFVHLFKKKKDGKRVSQFLPGIETQPRAGQLSITPLFVAMLICTNTPRSSATRQTRKTPPVFLIPRAPGDLNNTSVRQSRERCQTSWREMYCLPVHLKKTLLRLASSLISDIPHDMTDALKARIRHHLSFGVNLKVAAL